MGMTAASITISDGTEEETWHCARCNGEAAASTATATGEVWWRTPSFPSCRLRSATRTCAWRPGRRRDQRSTVQRTDAPAEAVTVLALEVPPARALKLGQEVLLLDADPGQMLIEKHTIVLPIGDD